MRWHVDERGLLDRPQMENSCKNHHQFSERDRHTQKNATKNTNHLLLLETSHRTEIIGFDIVGYFSQAIDPNLKNGKRNEIKMKVNWTKKMSEFSFIFMKMHDFAEKKRKWSSFHFVGDAKRKTWKLLRVKWNSFVGEPRGNFDFGELELSDNRLSTGCPGKWTRNGRNQVQRYVETKPRSFAFKGNSSGKPIFGLFSFPKQLFFPVQQNGKLFFQFFRNCENMLENVGTMAEKNWNPLSFKYFHSQCGQFAGRGKVKRKETKET